MIMTSLMIIRSVAAIASRTAAAVQIKRGEQRVIMMLYHDCKHGHEQ